MFVSVGGQLSNIVSPPSLYSISPTGPFSVYGGDLLSIYGSGFLFSNTVPSSSVSVQIGNYACNIVSVTDSYISCITVPVMNINEFFYDVKRVLAVRWEFM